MTSNENNPTVDTDTEFKSILDTVATVIEKPLRFLSLSIPSSGANTPRMSFSRQNSFNSFGLTEKLESIKQTQFPTIINLKSNSIYSLPNEITWLIISQIAKNCRRSGHYADLLNCSYLDKRFNCFSNIFLWYHIEISKRSSFQSLLDVLRDPVKKTEFGNMVKMLSFSRLSYMDYDDWNTVFTMCPKLISITLERCYLEEIPKEVSNVIHFKHLKNLTVSDSPKCPLQPILMICQQSPELNRLAISGCSYTEEDMCQLVSLCPKLTAIKLGSHASAAMSMTGGAGGDVFAQTLAEKCPLITLADLTGIISMTDMGFNYLMEALSNTLEKLYIRRAMQISVDSLLNVTILKNLRRLTFANVPHLTDQLVVNVMERIGSQLHFLQLENIPIEDESFIAVSTYCTNLTQLRIFECDDWLDIRNILVESHMKKLKVLIIHDCKSLEGEVECSHSLISESESPELDSFPENPRIRDTSYMSPTLESLPCTPTSATALSPFPSSSPRNHCEISFQLSHLEFIGCDSVSLDTVFNLLNHCRTLKRFIFAGQALNGKIRKHLLDRRPKLKASLYVLTPSTPGFE